MDVASGALVRVAVQTTSGSSVLGVSPHDGNPDETARRVWGLLVREGMEAGAAYDVYLAVSDELATPIAQPFTLDVTVSDEIVAFELTIK